MKHITVGMLVVGLLALAAGATDTEHNAIRVIPAPGKITVDGKIGDWDLSSGMFVCADAESFREKLAAWVHLMHDAKHLYILVRWVHPGAVKDAAKTPGATGYAVDHFRFRTFLRTPLLGPVVGHWDCRGGRGKGSMSVTYGRNFREGGVPDIAKKGGRQAFGLSPDGTGYFQEMAIPWGIVTKQDGVLEAGDNFQFTIEAIFAGGHETKDNFKAGKTPDKAFTFMSSDDWGPATVEFEGKVAPHPVRLSDAREFPVAMVEGRPVVDWKGLIQSKEPKGFKTIGFTVPGDGYVSMHLRDANGVVVRQLLGGIYYEKGDRKVQWDGLTTGVYRTPGVPVPPGKYTVHGIWHPGMELRLRGFACNGGRAPWDNGPTTNWGGDHGSPSDCASDGEKVYLGWTGAEAGKAMVAWHPKKGVVWKHSRGGIAGSPLLAAADGRVYGYSRYVYALNAKNGSYASWGKGIDGPDLPMFEAFKQSDYPGRRPEGISARGGKLYLSTTSKGGIVAVLDARTAKLLKVVPVPRPGRLHAVSDSLVYVVSQRKEKRPDPDTGEQTQVSVEDVVAVNPVTGKTRVIVKGLSNATGVTADAKGRVYVGLGGYENRVKVFSADGKFLKAIGRKGGRPPFGPWQPDGMLAIRGITIGPEGHLWVTEATGSPKRISVWDVESGKLVREFFGPTHYGASGATINPLDPDVMVGEGCEWRINPETGRAKCTGVFDDHYGGAARFCVGSNGRLYLVSGRTPGRGKRPAYHIYERIGEGKYIPRATIRSGAAASKPVTRFWADRNGDGIEVDEELQILPGWLTASGDTSLTMSMNADLTFYAKHEKLGPIQIRVKGFTQCGAPEYDLKNIKKIAVWGLGSPDNRVVLSMWAHMKDMYEAYDVETGKLLWEYPAPFSGVHGSHYAPGPEDGLIRGSFGPIGNAALPDPVGQIWGINTNVGEWHLLTAEGFYLARIFCGDPTKIRWPAEAVPGAVMDNCPPGLGGEDFGGSLIQGKDGKVYVQAGKTGIWNVEVQGLDRVRRLKIGSPGVTIVAADVAKAEVLRSEYLRAKAGIRRMTILRATPKFTGDLKRDFAGAQVVSYKKVQKAGVHSAAAWDDKFLYLAWDVEDKTPWINEAKLAEQMYLHGDTVDFQLGAGLEADRKRSAAVRGDVRISIGAFRDKPTAVMYRKVSLIKMPKTFSSGTVKKYQMDLVAPLGGAKVKVKVRPGTGYVVEAAIPLSVLDLQIEDGLLLTGDFGATHGGPDGQRTRLRTYWHNRSTGIVDDAVEELRMVPARWGELLFKTKDEKKSK